MIAGASKKMISERLRQLEAQGLVERRVMDTAPVSVEYEITPLGRTALEFLDALGVTSEPVSWGLELTASEREEQAAFFAQFERPACAVVLGTSKAEKNWRVSGYVDVVDALAERFGLQPVLVGGASHVEREAAHVVCSKARTNVIDALGDDLRRLLWLLEGSALVLSPDTGPLHIARAVGTPCVSLFGYTNPKRTGPWRAYEELIVDGYAAYPGEDYPLAPVYRDGMERITVDDVLAKVSLAVERYLAL